MKKQLFILALTGHDASRGRGLCSRHRRTSQHAGPDHARYARSQRSNQRARRNHTSQCARSEPAGQYSRCARSRRRHPARTLARDHFPGDPRAVLRQLRVCRCTRCTTTGASTTLASCLEWHSCLSFWAQPLVRAPPITRTAGPRSAGRPAWRRLARSRSVPVGRPWARYPHNATSHAGCPSPCRTWAERRTPHEETSMSKEMRR